MRHLLLQKMRREMTTESQEEKAPEMMVAEET
jgi:hypothetical protein